MTLITFEGGEGAGKTTLIEKIFATLKTEGFPVLHTRAPGGTPLGTELRRLLLDHPYGITPRAELFLFLADRAQHVEEIIRPALHKEQIVLCDRFNDSTLAYQGARGFDPVWLNSLLTFACNGITPQLTLYLDCDIETGFKRVHKAKGGKDRIESEERAFHQQIRAAFLALAEQEPNRFIVIDASQPADDVFAQAKEKIDALLAHPRK
jgi:dTMP kinase